MTEEGGPIPGRVAYHAARWVPVLVLGALTYALYPVARAFDAPIVEAGQVAPVEVLAPFGYVVKKSPPELARDADALAATVRPIYEYQPAVVDSVRRRVDRLFAGLDAAQGPSTRVTVAAQYGARLSADEAAYLESRARREALRVSLNRFFQRNLGAGVTLGGTIEQELSREVVVRREGRERVVPRDSVLTFAAFLERRSPEEPSPGSSLGDQIYLKLVNAVFQPSLVPNVSKTLALRAELRRSVDSVKDVVRANERVVAAHEVVTPETHARLVALRGEMLQRGRSGVADPKGLVGQTLSNALVLSMFWLLLMLYRRETYGSLRQVLVVAGLFALVIIGSAINRRFIAEGPELIPIPFATMLLTVLFSGRVSMVAAMVLAVLLGSQAAYSGQAGLYLAMIGGVAAALSMRVIRRRTQLLVAAGGVVAAFVVGAGTVALRFDWSLAELGSSIARGGANAIVSTALVMLALPVVESLAGVTTDLTLLELSDPSRPLLRRLATEAPGTYAHSVAMANLCESACNAIGANGLLARVGCYYHDVGKLTKPQFFVENQAPGSNPHDRLKPEASASIIRNHVRDGMTLAEEHGLPAIVAAFIPEHHGTADITYFLDRAKSRGVNVAENADQYRYPGPRPRSVETAVAFLADGVEAALRVLGEPTAQRISDAIEHIVEQRVQSGQLSEAPLTLAQLSRVRDEFVRVLTGMHHKRIDYPTASGGITSEWEAASRA
ncbi:MAG: HDIG domain-containing protein [Gemmatimonadetes bacterium]|nr:HDIG domain-containing protein [Gemmatimonadota bacterium]